MNSFRASFNFLANSSVEFSSASDRLERADKSMLSGFGKVTPVDEREVITESASALVRSRVSISSSGRPPVLMARQEFVPEVLKFAMRPVGTTKFALVMEVDGTKASTARFAPTTAKRREKASFMAGNKANAARGCKRKGKQQVLLVSQQRNK